MMSRSRDEGLTFGVRGFPPQTRRSITVRQPKWPKAVQKYQKFFDLWKDAEASQPELDDARKKLAGLRGM